MKIDLRIGLATLALGTLTGTFASTAQAQYNPRPESALRLTSEFSGTNEEGRYVIREDVSRRWTLNFTPVCTELACDLNALTTTTRLRPVLRSSRTAVDGNTVIELGGGMTLTYVNLGFSPTPNRSYWQLQLSGGQTARTVRLNHVPDLAGIF